MLWQLLDTRAGVENIFIWRYGTGQTCRFTISLHVHAVFLLQQQDSILSCIAKQGLVHAQFTSCTEKELNSNLSCQGTTWISTPFKLRSRFVHSLKSKFLHALLISFPRVHKHSSFPHHSTIWMPTPYKLRIWFVNPNVSSRPPRILYVPCINCLLSPVSLWTVFKVPLPVQPYRSVYWRSSNSQKLQRLNAQFASFPSSNTMNAYSFQIRDQMWTFIFVFTCISFLMSSCVERFLSPVNACQFPRRKTPFTPTSLSIRMSDIPSTSAPRTQTTNAPNQRH